MLIEIGPNEANQRLDKFIRKYLKQYPEIKLGDIFFRFRKGLILINGKKEEGNYRLKLGDKVELINQADKAIKNITKTKDQKIKEIPIEKIKKMIIFEDDNFVVFDKPADIVVHPGVGHMNDLTMTDYLLTYLQQLTTASFTPAFCYRLDRDTTGILIAAKNFQALQGLNELIRDKKVEKNYLALVIGDFPQQKKINLKIKKIYDKKFSRSKMTIDEKNGSESITEFKKLKTIQNKNLGELSLVQAKLETGKMHQIRIHLAYLGFPIIGDIIYGNPTINRIACKKEKICRQMLHAKKYKFTFDGKKYEFESNPKWQI